MSGAVGGLSATDYSVLFGTSGGSGLDPILQAITGGSGASGDPLTALTTATRNETQDVAQVTKQPAVERDIASFTAAVAGAKDIATLLKNPDALRVLLTANGLGDQAGYTALATKALLSDPSDPQSLASKLPDARWKTVAQTYQFATKGLAVLQDPKVLATITNGYAEVTWRQSLDATTPGLSTALDFRARAATATSVDQILGDATFRNVVTTALGIPKQIAYQDIGAQELAISSRLDVTRLQEPTFVDGLAQQFLLASQSSGGTAAPSLDGLAVQAAGLVV